MITTTSPLRSYEAHKKDIDAAISRVLKSGSYILGEEVDAFEKEFAAYLGRRYAVGCASGTDAVTLALKSLGIGLGDYVFCPSLSAVATAAAIERAGAIPVFVDVDKTTMTLDAGKLEAMARSVPGRAVVAVHLYGKRFDADGIKSVCLKYNLFLVEDCAQYCTKDAGSYGDAAAFSFYPTKNLGCIGDGGAVVFNDATFDHACRMLRQYGWLNRVSVMAGMNSRLDEIQAAILNAKLPHLDAENQTRRSIAFRYGNLWMGGGHVYHLFVARFNDRKRAERHFELNSIQTAIHYRPIHSQSAYGGYPRGDMTNTMEVAGEVLSLPMHPHMTEEEIEWVRTAYFQLL
jgi:dTDP-4-amino-4,6-dideoxygalactose transaminase